MISSGSGSGGGVILSAGTSMQLSNATLSANGSKGPNSELGSGGAGGGGAILLQGVQTNFTPSNPSQSLSAVVGTVTGGTGGTDEFVTTVPGDAGIITLVPQMSVITTAQSYSGPLIAQVGSTSQNTPTVRVQLGNVDINSNGSLTQGCDQLIISNSTMNDDGTYALGDYAQTLTWQPPAPVRSICATAAS